MRTAMLPPVMMMLMLMAFSGCAGKKPAVKEPVTPAVPKAFRGAPAWVFDPSLGGKIAAVGSAPMSKAGEKSSRNLAIEKGKDELARILGTKVKDMLRDFMETTGIGDPRTMDRVAAHVAKQVAQDTLGGCSVKEVWYQIDPVPPATRPAIFVWVVLDSSTVMADLRQVLIAGMKNEHALWRQFEARDASEQLDKEIEEEFGEDNSQ